MKHIDRAWSTALLALALTFIWMACNKPPTSHGPAQENSIDPALIGMWQGSKVEFTSNEDPTQTVNLIELGASFVMGFDENSTYQTTINLYGQEISETGFIICEGNSFTMQLSSGDIKSGSYEILADTLKVLVEDQTYDFNYDGTPDPATLNIEMVKIQD